ncbi:MAG: hypothetical protein K6D90_02290 [Lachnospiraceae bacterium]|nr:hypothetical protein [Lachnospiraceae bacterium]
MKLIKTKWKWTEVAILCALLIEFLFVVYANLFKIPATLDNDVAKLFTHAIEIWNTKKIFIPTWVNETMLELDTSLLFAVPIYGLCKNIYVAFGLSNILILLAYYFLFTSLLKRMNQSVSVILIACSLLTIPYSFGQLMYFDMMFFAGGFYGIKILLPLMLVWLLTTPVNERKVLFWIMAALSTAFSFIFSVSTGPYILLCGIIPVVICYVWFSAGEMKNGKELFSKWLFSLSNLLLYAQGIVAVLGIYISGKMQVDSTGSSMALLDIRHFVENLQNLAMGYMEQFAAFPANAVKVMSVTGISSFAHFVMAVLALIGLIAMTVRHFKRLKYTSEIGASQIVVYYLLILFLWNVLILLVCNVSSGSRYLLMPLVPMIPLIALYYRDLVVKVQGTVQRGLLHAAFFALIVVVGLLSDYAILKDDCNPPMAAENAKYDAVATLIDKYPEQQIFMLNDMGMSEYLRVADYDSGREYLSYMPKEGGVFVHDYYESRTDASYFEQAHLLLADEYKGSIDELPPYLKDCYEEVDSYQNIRIYRASVNRMDGARGYAANAHSVDYCYTPGYTIANGELTEDGSLLVTGNGDVCISSPWMNCAATKLTVSLGYETDPGDGVSGSLQVWDGNTHEMIASAPLTADAQEAVIEDLALNGCDIVVQVVVDENKTVSLKRFTYDRDKQ